MAEMQAPQCTVGTDSMIRAPASPPASPPVSRVAAMSTAEAPATQAGQADMCGASAMAQRLMWITTRWRNRVPSLALATMRKFQLPAPSLAGAR